MPTVLVSDVLATCRALLGDTAVTAGQIFTDTELLRFFPIAYRSAWNAMAAVEVPRVRKTAFYNLPAYTGYLARSTTGITDLGEIEQVEERGGLTNLDITGISGTTTASVTAAGHGCATGDQVVIPYPGPTGVSGVLGLWSVTKTSDDIVVLNGAIAAGSYSAGGVLSKSSDQFYPLEKVERIEEVGTYSELGKYAWNSDAFQFPPMATVRQLRIVYLSSGTPPTQTTDSIGIDDMHDFLAYATAGRAANAHGGRNAGGALLEFAYGPTQGLDNTYGGLLGDLQMRAIKTLQRRRNQMKPFIERRVDRY